MEVLVVIDMQNDFITGSLGTNEAQAIVPVVREMIERFEGPVFFTRDTHQVDYLLTQEGKKLPVVHCLEGSEGWEIEASLPVDDAVIFDKPTFGSPALGQYLAELATQDTLDAIHLIGVCTDICVISNALLIKAFLPEVPIIVHEKACAGVTPKAHDRALEAMKSCQIEIN